MGDALKRLREEKRKEYERLRQEQKPRVETCEHCHQLDYLSPVCSATGHLHSLSKKKIIGGLLVDQDCTGLRGSQVAEAINNARVRWQSSRTVLVKVDVMVVHIFQSFGISAGWSIHRYGILYGKYDKASHTVEVHAIYEPMQHGNAFTFEALDPQTAQGKAMIEEEQRVNLLAQALGLRRVGVICTHPHRDPQNVYISSRELLLCAKEQSIYGDECVLVTVSPYAAAAGAQNNRESPSSVSATTGACDTCQCEAWQASEQCVRLFQMGMLTESPKFSSAKGDEEVVRFVHSPQLALEVTEEKRESASGKLSFQTLEPNKVVDTHWFTSYVAVEKMESGVLTNLFMRRHRPGMANPGPANLKQYWNDPKRQHDSFVKRASDFQVLLYLLEALGAEKMIGVGGGGAATTTYAGSPVVAAQTLGGGGSRFSSTNAVARQPGWAALLGRGVKDGPEIRAFEQAVMKLMS